MSFDHGVAPGARRSATPGSAVLKVPSVVVPLSDNYVVSQHHRDAARVLASVREHGAFHYDQRIVKLVEDATGHD